MAFRLIRLYTGDDGESHFEEGTLELPRLEEPHTDPGPGMRPR